MLWLPALSISFDNCNAHIMLFCYYIYSYKYLSREAHLREGYNIHHINKNNGLYILLDTCSNRVYFLDGANVTKGRRSAVTPNRSVMNLKSNQKLPLFPLLSLLRIGWFQEQIRAWFTLAKVLVSKWN